MDLSFSPDDEAFRQEVRAFIRDHCAPEMRVKDPYRIIKIKERSCPPPTKQLK
jgi:alkylation response protein AidB-like acyl-CoA dehydrogenase